MILQYPNLSKLLKNIEDINTLRSSDLKASFNFFENLRLSYRATETSYRETFRSKDWLLKKKIIRHSFRTGIERECFFRQKSKGIRFGRSNWRRKGSY